MHIRKPCAGFLALACAWLLALGCGSREPAPEKLPEPIERENVRFAVIPKQLDNPVFEYARIGAMQAAKELDVQVLWRGPETYDADRQAEILREFVAQEVDGIAVSCANPDLLRQPIDEAVEAGIPVVTWDSDSPQSKRAVFFGIDDYAAGQIIAEELGELIDGKGTVAVLSGNPESTNLLRRETGVREYLEEKYMDVDLLETVYCDDDVEKAVAAVIDTMTSHPALAGWAMVGGWPLYAKSGLESIDSQVTKVAAMDPLPEAWHWMEKEKLQVGIGQKVFAWGRQSVTLLWRLHNGDTITEARDGWFVNSGIDRVVLDPSQFAHPERYIALEDYRKQFQARLETAGER